MPDLFFEDARLVSIYDDFDGQRNDLVHYVSLIKELGAQSILDLGSGTGCFACLLVEHGFNVIGVEPAKASIDFARTKKNADKVQWFLGDAGVVPSLKVDLAIMTGNVAQVFVTDQLWLTTLTHLHRVIDKKGHLVFEVRNPEKKAWLGWNREKTFQRVNTQAAGWVHAWCEIKNVSNDLVNFQWTYVFESDNKIMTSNSTLRFRDLGTIEKSLIEAGFSIKDIRDAPDRPGSEFVFIAAPI